MSLSTMLRRPRGSLHISRYTRSQRIPARPHHYLPCSPPVPMPALISRFSTTSRIHEIRKVLKPGSPENASRSDPGQPTASNVADKLQKLMENDGFRTWGFVLYRCTYKSDSDWTKFMSRYLEAVSTALKTNGVNILDQFAPTVFEDPSFEGSSSFTIREHFNKWAMTAPKEEQGISAKEAQDKKSGRYRFCIMVDEESLRSVLDTPASNPSGASAFVRLVYGSWKPLELSDEEIAGYDHYQPLVFDPVDGCTEWDVGCMRVPYHVVQTYGYVRMHDFDDWDSQYVRDPGVGLCI